MDTVSSRRWLPMKFEATADGGYPPAGGRSDLRGGRLRHGAAGPGCLAAQHGRVGGCREPGGGPILGGHPRRRDDARPRRGGGLGPRPAQPRAGPPCAASVPEAAQDGREGPAAVASPGSLSDRPRRTLGGHRGGVRLAAPRAVPASRPAPGAATSACRRCCSSRPRWCGRPSSGAPRGPGGGGGSSAQGERPRCEPPTSWPAAPPRWRNRRRRLGVRRGAGRSITSERGGPRAVRRDRPIPTAPRTSWVSTDRFVVGWVGSFRRFHALEQAVEAVGATSTGPRLLLVGDGPERPRIEQLARERRRADACAPARSPQRAAGATCGRWTPRLVLAPEGARSTTRR